MYWESLCICDCKLTTPTEADSTGTAPDDAVTASSTTATTG